MPQEESVNVLDSLSSETEDSDPSAEGEKPSKTSDRSDVNKASEKLRKENSELKKQIEEIKSTFEARIEQLEKKPNLTQGQEDELQRLKNQVELIERNPEARPWMELQRKIARDEILKARSETDNNIANESRDIALDWVESKAEYLKIDPKKLSEDILDILDGGKWADLSPLSRVKKAFSQLQRWESKYKNPETPEHAETNNKRVERKFSPQEAVKESVKSGKWSGILGAVAKAQEK